MSAPQQTELAVSYARNTPQHALHVAVPRGVSTRVHLPDDDAKAHLVTAVLKARGEPDEDLELFGEHASRLSRRRRDALRARVGAVSPIVGLVANLNTWENISLPAAYRGVPRLEEVAKLAHEVIAGFGFAPEKLLARLPEQLGALERKVAALARLLVVPPELLVLDDLEDGLSYAECNCATRFETEFRARQPQGTVLYVDIKEDA